MICLKTIWVLIWPFIFWFLVEHLVLAMWFFTHSVLIQVFVFQPWLCPCGYVCYVCMRVSSYDSLTFIIFLALVCTGKLKFISSTKKTQELPCGLLLKLTITPQYAITVITHSCPINNTAVIFYWIVWGCWKCKGDLGLKLEVGSWVGTGNFYLASQLRENLCSTHKHWTFPSLCIHACIMSCTLQNTNALSFSSMNSHFKLLTGFWDPDLIFSWKVSFVWLCLPIK